MKLKIVSGERHDFVDDQLQVFDEIMERIEALEMESLLRVVTLHADRRARRLSTLPPRLVPDSES